MGRYTRYSLAFAFTGLLPAAYATPWVEITDVPNTLFLANSESSNYNGSRQFGGYGGEIGRLILLSVSRAAFNPGYEYAATHAQFELTYHTGSFAPGSVSTGSTVTATPVSLVTNWRQYRSETLDARDWQAAENPYLQGNAIAYIPNILPPFIQLYYGLSSENGVYFGNMRVARKLVEWTVAEDHEIVSKTRFYPVISRIVVHCLSNETLWVNGFSSAQAEYGIQLNDFQANERKYIPFGGYTPDRPVNLTINDGSSDTVFTTVAAGGEIDIPGDLANGSYTVTLSRPGMLTRVRTMSITSYTPTLASSFDLVFGDTDASGEIDAGDIDNVIAGYGLVEGDQGWETGTFPAGLYLDVDASGEIDAGDIDLVIDNYGLTSD